MIERKREQMAREMPSAGGYITRYLEHLKSEFGPEGAAAVEAHLDDLLSVFSTEQGVRVLILLEKAAVISSLPDGSSDCALREANAVRNFNLEIRRLITHVGSRKSKR